MPIRKGQGGEQQMAAFGNSVFPKISLPILRLISTLENPAWPAPRGAVHTAFPGNFTVAPFPGILTSFPKSKMRACVVGETLTPS